MNAFAWKAGLRKACAGRRRVFGLCLLAVALIFFPRVSTFGGAASEAEKLRYLTALIQKGELAQAERRLWDILSRRPDDAQALNLLGVIRVEQKRNSEAEALFQRAIQLDSKLVPAFVNLGSLYEAEKQRDKAMAALLKAQELAPRDPQTNLELAEVNAEMGKYQESLEAIGRVPHSARPASLLPVLAADYLGVGRVGEARALAPLVLGQSSKAPEIAVGFADAFLAHNMTNDAIHVLDAAAKMHEPTAEMMYVLGLAYERKGNAAAAQGYFERSLKLQANSPDALLALARVLASQGQLAKTLPLLEQARKQSPDSPAVLRSYVIACLRAERNGDALEAAQQLVRLSPDDAENFYLLGVARLQNQDYGGAEKAFVQFVSAKPEDPRGYFGLGIVYLVQLNYAAAKTSLEHCLELDPQSSGAKYFLGVAARDQGDNGGAIQFLKQVIAVQPDNVDALTLLGSSLIQTGYYSEASDVLNRAVKLRPDDGSIHYQLGLLDFRLGRTADAQREMARYRELAPRNPQYNNNVPPGVQNQLKLSGPPHS